MSRDSPTPDADAEQAHLGGADPAPPAPETANQGYAAPAAATSKAPRQVMHLPPRTGGVYRRAPALSKH